MIFQSIAEKNKNIKKNIHQLKELKKKKRTKFI